MKNIILIVIIIGFHIIACNSNTKDKKGRTKIDTIQTKSGLQYYYIKHGKGRKVEPGSEVGTYLSLMVNDSVVWNSDSLPDKQFAFIAGFTRLIKGFTEATMLLREGDEIVAILPDSLAYGAKGAGDIIPPNATLVYDKFKVVKVEEAKSIMCDTLFEVLEEKGFDSMLSKYKQITTTIDSSNYHIGNEHLSRLCDKLNDIGKHEEALDVASYFSKITDDIGLRYKIVLSLEGLGALEQAVDSLEVIYAIEPDNTKMKDKLDELNKMRLSNSPN